MGLLDNVKYGIGELAGKAGTVARVTAPQLAPGVSQVAGALGGEHGVSEYLQSPGQTPVSNTNQTTQNTDSQNEITAVLGATDTSAYTSPYGNASLNEDQSYLNDQEGLLRGMLGKYDTTLNQGKTSIQDSYNKEATRANQQRSQAMEDFNVKREDTTRAKVNAVGQANTNSRTLADSVRRILGMASGSG